MPAVDQTYRWLDLPGMSGEYPADVALSPDGRRLAYFLAGEPESAFRQSDVVGYAVYDTVTGEVARHQVPTEHGLVLAQALARLTSKQRTVLVLRNYEDLTERQAAEAMGVRVGTIKSQPRHAPMRLREVAPELADRIGEPVDV